MPKIDLISRDEAFEIGDEDCRFVLRRLDPNVIRESRQRHTRRLEAEGPGQPPREEIDEAEVDKDLLDYIVQDWKGVLGPDGQEAPCTRENKYLLPPSVKAQILATTQVVNRQGNLTGTLKNLSAPSGAPGQGGA